MTTPPFGTHPAEGDAGTQDEAWAEPTPADDPLIAYDLGGWLRRVIGVLRRSGLRLLALQAMQLLVQIALFAVVLVPLYLSGMFTLVNEDGSPVPPSVPLLLTFFAGLVIVVLLGAALAAWVFAASTWVIVGDAFEEPVRVLESLRLARRRVPALIGWGLLAYLAVGLIVGLGWLVSWSLGWALLGSVGLTLLLAAVLALAPLLWLGVIFSAALPGAVIFEQRDPGRCFELVTRRWWPTLARLALAGLVGLALVLLLALLQLALAPAVVAGGDGAIVLANIVLTVVQLAAGLAVAVLTAAVSVVTYAELRGHWDGSTTSETLAGDLGL